MYIIKFFSGSLISIIFEEQWVLAKDSRKKKAQWPVASIYYHPKTNNVETGKRKEYLLPRYKKITKK